MTEPLVLTVAEVARLLQVSKWTVASMTRDGRLPKVPGLRRIRIPRAAVLTLMEGVYDNGDGESDGSTSAQAKAPRRRNRHQAERPLASAAVGGGGALHRRIGPTPGDVVVRRVTRGSGPAPA